MNCACGKPMHNFNLEDLKLDIPTELILEIYKFLNNSAKFSGVFDHPANGGTHPICNNCKNVLEYQCLMMDTNMACCSHDGCRRTIFMNI